MNSLNTSLAKITLVLICGVATGFYFAFSAIFICALLTFLLLGLFLVHLKGKETLTTNPLFGTLAFTLFFVLGIFTTTIHLPVNRSSHFTNHLASEEAGKQQLLQLQISEVLKPDNYNDKFIAEIEYLNKMPVDGRILLLSPKDSTEKDLAPGNRLMILAEIKNINKPLNPHQFDYHKFMSLRGVHGQVNLTTHNFELLRSEEKNLRSWAYKVRKIITRNLQENGFEPAELSIIQALLLGQKQQISEEVYQNYADAGAVHILAVSGLHVGIIMLILTWLLSPLKGLKKGKMIRPLLVIFGLWTFAVLSGLSPSVVRAVTMFSFVSIGLEIGRRSSTINSVCLSLLLLVLIRPQWIFDVGFQLSYSAVLAILLIQPLFMRLWQPQNKTVRYLWILFTTTAAAQLGVFPLSLFYFHQFPGLFFLSNLVILPVLGFILASGILIIFLASLSILPNFLTELYQFLISNLNGFVSWVARQENFLFKDIAFDLPQTLAFYLLLITLLFFFYSPGYRRLVSVLVSVLILQLVYIEKVSEEAKEFVIFHRSGRTILASQKGQNLTLFTNHLNPADEKMIRNYSIGKNIQQQKKRELENVYGFKDKLLLIIDSTGIYTEKVRPDLLVLSNSPKINLEKALEKLQPKIVISDGSNYKFLQEHWRKTSKKKNISFYSTAESGAFILND